MPNENSIREIATRACCDALQEKSQELAENIARRMEGALASQAAQPLHTKELRDGAVLIAGSRTQTEALDRLLAGSSAITPACGLLILRGTHATGWSCRGIATLETFKRATLDCSRGVAASVINSGSAAAAQIYQIDPTFIAKLGLEHSAPLLLIPVLLKERVAALLIAVSQHSNDLEALELLVQVAQLTLDLVAYRKASPQPGDEPPHQAVPHPTQTEHATHVPAQNYGMPATVAAHEVEPEQAYAASASNGTIVASPTVQFAAPAYHAEAATQQIIAPLPDQVHEKARRFAKLLVEEIKLYNQTKVAEGRARGDLYSRLRDDIEKSRASYHKRYGETVNDVDYFTQELMRILAGNDPEVMGAGFPG